MFFLSKVVNLYLNTILYSKSIISNLSNLIITLPSVLSSSISSSIPSNCDKYIYTSFSSTSTYQYLNNEMYKSCKLMENENEYNYVYNYITDLSYSTLLYIPVFCLYGLILYLCINLIDKTNSRESEYIPQFTSLSDLRKNTNLFLNSNDIEKKQYIIESMLSTKSLEHYAILYYIFKMKGNYQINMINKNIGRTNIYEDNDNDNDNDDCNSCCNCSDYIVCNGCNDCNDCNDCNECSYCNDTSVEIYNSFEEFKNCSSLYSSNSSNNSNNNSNSSNSSSNTYKSNPYFNLDESLEPNLKFNIGDKQYNLNLAHLHFCSWIYYSGLYDYVIGTNDIMLKTLNEMNEYKLLTGNLFLRYQIFLLEQDKRDLEKQDLDLQKRRELETGFEKSRAQREELNGTLVPSESESEEPEVLIINDTYGQNFNRSYIEDLISIRNKLIS